ncbi:MAG TPA: hypothetical protein VFO48_06595 [Vicinamibacterales bacterium]|nr:hypothetical protein [Vicinamibacterales bacterium]
METLKRFIHEDEGQNLVEYALLAGLVALVAIVAVGNVGTEIDRVRACGISARSAFQTC